MSKNQEKDNNSTVNDAERIVANGETVNYLQNTGKAMLNDLKDFSNYSNHFFSSLNEKLAYEFKSVLQYSSEYKGSIDSMATDTNERMTNMNILKQLREQLYSANPSS